VVKGEKKGHWSGLIKVGLDSFYDSDKQSLRSLLNACQISYPNWLLSILITTY